MGFTSDFSEIKQNQFELAEDVINIINVNLILYFLKKFIQNNEKKNIDPIIFKNFLEFGENIENPIEKAWFKFIFNISIDVLFLRKAIRNNNFELYFELLKKSLNLFYQTGKKNYYNLVLSFLFDYKNLSDENKIYFKNNFVIKCKNNDFIEHDAIIEKMNKWIKEHTSHNNCNNRILYLTKNYNFLINLQYNINSLFDIKNYNNQKKKVFNNYNNFDKQNFEKIFENLNESNTPFEYFDITEDIFIELIKNVKLYTYNN